MLISLHKQATTTPKVRAAIRASNEPAWVLAERHGVSEQTVCKWRKRDDVQDRSHTPHRLQTTLTPAQEAVAVALRTTLLLPLDDLLAVVREFVNPNVSRSGLDRCLRRHGVGNLRELKPKAAKPTHKPFKAYEPGYLHIDVKYLPQMADEERRRYLFVAIDRATRWVFVRIYSAKTAANARRFLRDLDRAAPMKITRVLTDNGKEFTDRLFGLRRRPATGAHEFDLLCAELDIDHRLAPPMRPQTNGMVERFNGRIEDVLQSHRFRSGEDLEHTILRYVQLYNGQLPQTVLKGRTPIGALKDWHRQKPELFKKRPYNHPGCDTYPNNGNTTGAITSLLTGMLPTRTKVVFPPDSLKGKNALRSLPRLLRNAGYYTNNIAVPHYADASEQNMLGAFGLNNNRAMFSSSVPVAFNYKTTNWLLDRIVAETAGIARDVLWLGEMPNPYTQVDGLKRGYNYGNNDIKRLQNLLGTIRNKSEPFFINSHFLGPHGPFFNPPLRHFASATANRGEPWQKDLYDDAILSFDMYVKRVYTALKVQGLLERTVLVIMSDHGIGHDPRKQVPMMMRFPNAAHGGQAIEENVQVIDVTATLIDYLGGKKPAWMQGDSLIGSSLPADRKIFSAGVKKIAFVPGVGVVGNEHGRYGTMDYFFMVHCGSQYRLDVDDGSFEVTRDDEGAQPCTPDQVFDEAAAKAAMREHLSAHY